MGKRFKVQVTEVEPDCRTATPDTRCFRVEGSDKRSVASAVSRIRELAGPRPVIASTKKGPDSSGSSGSGSGTGAGEGVVTGSAVASEAAGSSSGPGSGGPAARGGSRAEEGRLLWSLGRYSDAEVGKWVGRSLGSEPALGWDEEEEGEGNLKPPGTPGVALSAGDEPPKPPAGGGALPGSVAAVAASGADGTVASAAASGTSTSATTSGLVAAPSSGGVVATEVVAMDTSDVWEDEEVTTTQVREWSVSQVQRWAMLSVGVSEENASKVALDGPALLAFPLFPTEELETALQSCGVTPDAVEAVVDAYASQRWTISTEV
jgi:hypothetical protein